MANEHKVLLVEDDEGLRYAMEIALQRAELTVELAVNGREAVQALNERANGYCCVILDMLLPSIHGSSIVAHIARTAPKLAVVAVTGYPDRVLFTDPGDRHVVKAIFAKPVDPVDVAAYVRSRCSRETASTAPSASPPTG
ncbi:MAG TPA: response regulator [Thermoanaerobaculia bacterium]|jgi:DNA-binding NtrC family response regulator